MSKLSKMTVEYLGANRKKRVDQIYESVCNVPVYGQQISRNNLQPQKCAYAIDVANSMYGFFYFFSNAGMYLQIGVF